MVDPPQILGLQTGSSISEQKNNCLGVKDFCKLDLSAIKKWCSFKKSPSTSSHSPGRKAELEAKSQAATQKTAEVRKNDYIIISLKMNKIPECFNFVIIARL